MTTNTCVLALYPESARRIAQTRSCLVERLQKGLTASDFTKVPQSRHDETLCRQWTNPSRPPASRSAVSRMPVRGGLCRQDDSIWTDRSADRFHLQPRSATMGSAHRFHRRAAAKRAGFGKELLSHHRYLRWRLHRAPFCRPLGYSVLPPSCPRSRRNTHPTRWRRARSRAWLPGRGDNKTTLSRSEV